MDKQSLNAFLKKFDTSFQHHSICVFSILGAKNDCFVTPTKKVVFCPLTEGFENKRSRGGTPRESVFQPEVKGRNHDLLSGSSEIIFSFFTHEIEVFYSQTHLCAGRKKTLVRGSKTSLFVPAEKTRWWYRFRF